MELANLILEYIKALVWPVVVTFVLWRFRSPVARLIERIVSESRELEGFGFKARLSGASPDEQALTVQKEVKQFEFPSPDSGVAHADEPRVGPKLDARERYLLAEELVLRALEARWGDAIARQRVVELPNGRRLQFDGVLDGPRQVVVIEVKLLSRPVIPGEVFINASENMIALRQHVGKAVIGVVALVALDENDAYRRLATEVQQRAASAPTPLVVELFYLPELTAQFLGSGAELPSKLCTVADANPST